MSSDEEIRADVLTRIKPALPDFLSVRELARKALAEQAEDECLDLSESDVRYLAHAVVDAIEDAVNLRGVLFAYEVVDREANGAHRYLVAGKTPTDREGRAVLNLHEQYVKGMAEMRRQIGDRLRYMFRQWRGAPTTAVAALPAPAGTVETRELVGAQAAA